MRRYNTDRAYAYYWNVIDSLPSYMSRNLKEMPNNKGYSWRGVTFYGECPEERGEPTIVFEKKHDNLIIHQYNKGIYSQTIKSRTKPSSKYDDKDSNKKSNQRRANNTISKQDNSNNGQGRGRGTGQGQTQGRGTGQTQGRGQGQTQGRGTGQTQGRGQGQTQGRGRRTNSRPVKDGWSTYENVSKQPAPKLLKKK